MATYLITQATGQQSRYVIKHLLADGAKIHAVVRDLKKTHPILHEPGVTLFEGQSTDFDTIFKAAQGCKGAFLNTFPIPGLEAQQAKTVVEASKKAGVEILVASTTLCTGNRLIWDDDVTKEIGLHAYWSSKAEVEDIVRAAGFKAYTILRPAFIHFNFFMPSSAGNYPRLHTHGELDHLYNEGITVPHTDGNDIGIYALAAFKDPSKFHGEEIELGNDLHTVKEVRDILVKVSGRDVKEIKRTEAEINEMGINCSGQRFFLWANAKNDKSFEVSSKENEKKFGIPFTSLEQSLQRDRALLLESLPAN